jgi:hypothetical protein
MRNKITRFVFVGLLVFLGIAVPAAQATEKCTLQTMTGTYVFNDRGSSTILDLSAAPPFPVHFAAAVAPFVAVGEITFNHQGVGNGFYWIQIGSLSGGLNPIPVQVTIIEMNEDCTGKFKYSIILPGSASGTLIEERFVAFDEGREYRSVPTFIDQTGVPTLAWIGTGQRVRKPDEPLQSCRPQNVHGTYLITAENIVALTQTAAFTDTILFRMNISMTGIYTGTLYEKLGPVFPIELPIFGTFTVNSDCSFSWNLNVQGITTTPIHIRGVLFNEGKDLYGLAIEDGIESSFAQGTRISQ